MKSRERDKPILVTGLALRWQIGLAFLAFIMIGANDGGVGVVLPSLQNHYQVDKATVGLLFMLSTAGYLVGGFSSGLMVEKLGQRRFLMLGAAAFALGAFAVSLRPVFGLLLGSFFVLGFGVAIVDAGLNTYIARQPNSTPILNYLHAFYAAGAFTGPVIASGILALGASWNTVYRVWVGLGLLVLAGIALLFKVPARYAAPGARAEQRGGNVMAAALRLRAVWLGAFFLLIYTGSEVATGTWSFTFLTEARGQPLLLAGWTVSAYWLGLMLGRVVLGRLSLRIGGKDLIRACLVGVIAGLLIVWMIPLGVAAILGLFLAGFSLGPIFPTTIALMPAVMPDRLVASAIGFVASFAAAGGALMPWLAGNLAQSIGLWTLMPFVMLLALADMVLWIFLARQ